MVELKGIVDEETEELYRKALEGKLNLMKKIATLKEGEKGFTIEAKVEVVFATSLFSNGKYRKIKLNDGSGEVQLLLFNDEIELFRKVIMGDIVKITDVWVKDGVLRLSPYSTVEIMQRQEFTEEGPLQEGRVNVRGLVRTRQGASEISIGNFTYELEGLPRGIDGQVALSYAVFDGKKLRIDSKTRVFVKRS